LGCGWLRGAVGASEAVEAFPVRPASQYTKLLIDDDLSGGWQIDHHALLDRSIGAAPILAPLEHVSQHVEKPQVVWQKGPAVPGVVLAVGEIPGVFLQETGRDAIKQLKGA